MPFSAFQRGGLAPPSPADSGGVDPLCDPSIQAHALFGSAQRGLAMPFGGHADREPAAIRSSACLAALRAPDEIVVHTIQERPDRFQRSLVDVWTRCGRWKTACLPFTPRDATTRSTRTRPPDPSAIVPPKSATAPRCQTTGRWNAPAGQGSDRGVHDASRPSCAGRPVSKGCREGRSIGRMNQEFKLAVLPGDGIGRKGMAPRGRRPGRGRLAAGGRERSGPPERRHPADRAWRAPGHPCGRPGR